VAAGGKLDEGRCARYMRQIVGAVSHCHERGIVHLDLSLENILLCADDTLRVSDFGMARELKRTSASSSSSSSPSCDTTPSCASAAPCVCGKKESDTDTKYAAQPSPPPSPSPPTVSKVVVPRSSPAHASTPAAPSPPRACGGALAATERTEPLSGRPGKVGYMAPEVFAGLPFDGRKADTFSLGVILFLMLTGIPPWRSPALSDDRYRLIMSGSLAKLLRAWGVPVSPCAFHLLSRLLCPPEDRFTIDQVASHPFLAARTTDGQTTKAP